MSPPRNILDVGCGEGLFGEEIKNRFSSIVWGVEPDYQAARRAMLKMDNVFSSTWDCAKKDLPDRHFDAIFFNDVLEHMVDPEQCLREAKSKLADSGIVYASIPNVIFIENIAKIVWRRDWKYECAGILDRTHLRFYTRKSIERLFESTGFTCEKIIPLNTLSSWKWRFIKMIALGRVDDFLSVQYGVAAVIS